MKASEGNKIPLSLPLINLSLQLPLRTQRGRGESGRGEIIMGDFPTRKLNVRIGKEIR